VDWPINNFKGQLSQRFRNAVPVPLISIDGTAIDHACRHSQMPVLFTLGILKQILRIKSKAWCDLGFVKTLFTTHINPA